MAILQPQGGDSKNSSDTFEKKRVKRETKFRFGGKRLNIFLSNFPCENKIPPIEKFLSFCFLKNLFSKLRFFKCTYCLLQI